MTDNSARDSIIREWMQARTNAAHWSAREMQLRVFIAQAAFGYTQVDGNSVGNTQKLDLGGGYELKMSAPLKYTLKDGAGTRAAMQYAMNLAVPLPKPLIKWSPELSVTAYKAADDQLRKLLAPDLTTKPSVPTLTVTEPK